MLFKKKTADAATDAGDAPEKKTPLRVLREWVVAFAVVIAILSPIRSVIADWNDVPSGSMEPTILIGDRIFVNKLSYGLRVPFTTRWITRWSDPAPGDITILFSPKDGTRLVKRVVAGPGDTLELRENQLRVNGSPVQYSPAKDRYVQVLPEAERSRRILATEQLGAGGHPVMITPGIPAIRDFGPVTLGPDEFWVLGDNRDQSGDSRIFGAVPRHLIVGRSPAIAFSVDKQNFYVPRFSRFFTALD